MKKILHYLLCITALFFISVSVYAECLDVEKILSQHLKENPDSAFDQYALLEALDNSSDFHCSILKQSRWKEDAIILKLESQIDKETFAVKIHPESFPLCSHIYQEETIKRINKTHASTKVIKSFLLNKDVKRYRVVVYHFSEGQPLKKALDDKKINIDDAVEQLLSVVKKLNTEKIYLVLRDKNDFLLGSDGALTLTDWNALVDVREATRESIEQYVPFKKRCIEDFIGNQADYDMSVKTNTQ